MSTFYKGFYIEFITKALSDLTTQVKLNNAINKYSINIEAEDFYAGFLNVVYGFRLKSGNHEKKPIWFNGNRKNPETGVKEEYAKSRYDKYLCTDFSRFH